MLVRGGKKAQAIEECNAFRETWRGMWMFGEPNTTSYVRKANIKSAKQIERTIGSRESCPNKHVARRHDALCPHGGHQRGQAIERASARCVSKGQASVELAVIFAMGLIVLLIVSVLANERLIDLSTQKQMNDARTSVRDLADAANHVYQQGIGAKKRVFVILPGDTDLNLSYIGKPLDAPNGTESKAILLNFRGTDILASTNPEVHGAWPKTTGGHWMWVESKGTYVTVGNAYLDADKGALYFNTIRSASKSTPLTVFNRGEDNKSINVSVSFGWSDAHVTVNSSSTNFTLASGENRTLTITAASDAQAGGLYSGDMYLEGTGDEISELLLIPITVEVELPITIINGTQGNESPALRVIPSTWTLKLGPNETASRTFIICTNQTYYVSSVSFTPSSGEPGSWVTGYATNIGPIDADSCDIKALGITMPANTTSGVRTGNITVDGDGYVTGINLTVTADYVGPIASNLSSSPAKPRSHTNVTITAICDETATYANNVSGAQVKVDSGSWQDMSAADGLFNSVTEQVTKNVGNYSGGWHNVSVRCLDSHGNWGNATNASFRVYKNILFVTLSSSMTSIESDWNTWMGSQSSGLGYSWAADYAIDNDIVANSSNLTDYLMIFMADYDSGVSGLNTTLTAYMNAGGKVMFASDALQYGPRTLGYTASAAAITMTTDAYVVDNTHYITSPFNANTTYFIQAGSGNNLWYLQPDFRTLGGTRLVARSSSASTYTTIGYRGNLVVIGPREPSRFNSNGNTLATRSIDYCIANSGLT